MMADIRGIRTPATSTPQDLPAVVRGKTDTLLPSGLRCLL